VMSQTTIRVLCRAFAAVALAAASLLAVPAVGRAQEVVALVDGEPVTALDIEQRAKFIQMSTQKTPARKDVLDGLIDEILEIREAKKFGINVPDSEVDNAFANVGSRMGADPAKLTQMLAKGGTGLECAGQGPFQIEPGNRRQRRRSPARSA
jgi:peptidyl-prolyl cis-trans isomerase SurA